MNDQIKKFFDKQKEQGISENEIQEALFVAITSATALTLQEVDKNPKKEFVDKIKAQTANPKEFYDKLDSNTLLDEVANPQGETFRQIFERNLLKLINEA